MLTDTTSPTITEVMNSEEYKSFFMKNVKMPAGHEYPAPYLSFGLVTHNVTVTENRHVGDDTFTFPIKYHGEVINVSGQILFRKN